MNDSLFISTDAHLCKFQQVTGGNWRQSIYVQCGDCPRAISRRCKNMLCAFDADGTPVLVPEQDVERLWDVKVDKTECLAVLPKLTFCELYKDWINLHILDPHACPLSDLRVNWAQPDVYTEKAFHL